MFCHKCKCCSLMWWSGFFALASLVHIVRLISRIQVQVGIWVVPMQASIGVAIIAGLISLFLCKAGCGACNCKEK